jgi:hypothetical protein
VVYADLKLSGPARPKGHTMNDPLPYAARRANDEEPWPLEELVRAQQLACEGKSFEEIARALGRTAEDVRRRLDPDQVETRPEFARVGYPHLKRR